MPRQARESSGTGIYHVMMRGINHQNIFENQEDYYQFLKTLDMMALLYEPDGTPGGRNYILYAYYQRILKNKNKENPFCGLYALVECLCQVSHLCLLKQALPPKA